MKRMQSLAVVVLVAFVLLIVIRLGGTLPCAVKCPEGANAAQYRCSQAMSGECFCAGGPQLPNGMQQFVPEGSRKTSPADLSRFAGTWRAVNSSLNTEKNGGQRAGEYLVLGVSKKERRLNMALLSVASSPGRRVAHIETTLPVDGRLAGRFTFEDDGWGNSGEGAISLRDGRVVVEVKLRGKSGSDWHIFSGQKVFIRER